MGCDAEPSPRLSRHRAALCNRSERRNLYHRARLQHSRRRFARRHRPKARRALEAGPMRLAAVLARRMYEHYEWREPFGEMTHLSMPPPEYFRRQGFCAVGCDEKFVSLVIDAFGDDNLVTTTDNAMAERL